MTIKRNAYLLTTNQESDRTQFASNVLKKIGFTVIYVQAIPNVCPITSNKISMMKNLLVEFTDRMNLVLLKIKKTI